MDITTTTTATNTNTTSSPNGTMPVVTDVDSDPQGPEVHECGYLGCRPAWLQRFNSPRCLLAAVMFYTFIQGFMASGVKNVIPSTLERRYDMSAGEVAWIYSAADIGGAFLTLLFGWLGTWVHKGRTIALGALALSAGCLLFTAPHFLAGDYEIGIAESDLCLRNDNGTSDPCDNDDNSGGQAVNSYTGVFIVAQLLQAVGGCSLHTLVVPLLDENVKRRNAALYIGCYLSCTVLGPGAGFVIGGYTLTIYVDISRADEVTITPSDPRWVGAWWLGFLLTAILALPCALVIAAFPRQLPNAVKHASSRQSEAHGGYGEKESSDPEFGHRPRDILVLLKTLAWNPVYILLTLAGIVEYLAIVGFATFLPKIIQFQFAQTPTMSAVWAGVIVLPSAASAAVLGGLIPRWLDLRVRGLLVEMLVAVGVAALLIPQFLLKCDLPAIAGVSAPYYVANLTAVDLFDSSSVNLTHPCNVDCGCTTVSYDPVCSTDTELTYFTPCHAGCLSVANDTETTLYTECSCIGWTANDTGGSSSLPTAAPGVCPAPCSVLPAFLVLFFLINVATFIPATAGQTTAVRVVPDKQRAFAFGLQSMLVRLFGSVPGPLVFAAIFDGSCWLWQYKCDVRGSCWIYDVDSLAIGITILGLVIKTLSFSFVALAIFLYKPPPPAAQETAEKIVVSDMIDCLPATSDDDNGTSDSRDYGKLEKEEMGNVGETGVRNGGFDGYVMESTKL